MLFSNRTVLFSNRTSKLFINRTKLFNNRTSNLFGNRTKLFSNSTKLFSNRTKLNQTLMLSRLGPDIKICIFYRTICKRRTSLDECERNYRKSPPHHYSAREKSNDVLNCSSFYRIELCSINGIKLYKIVKPSSAYIIQHGGCLNQRIPYKPKLSFLSFLNQYFDIEYFRKIFNLYLLLYKCA